MLATAYTRDVLDELVWEEVNTRLQDPVLVLEAYQDHKIQRSEEDGATEERRG